MYVCGSTWRARIGKGRTECKEKGKVGKEKKSRERRVTWGMHAWAWEKGELKFVWLYGTMVWFLGGMCCAWWPAFDDWHGGVIPAVVTVEVTSLRVPNRFLGGQSGVKMFPRKFDGVRRRWKQSSSKAQFAKAGGIGGESSRKKPSRCVICLPCSVLPC